MSQATASLRENWGEYMTECTFNWRVVKNVITHCHVYDKEVNYRPFDFAVRARVWAAGAVVARACGLWLVGGYGYGEWEHCPSCSSSRAAAIGRVELVPQVEVGAPLHT